MQCSLSWVVLGHTTARVRRAAVRQLAAVLARRTSALVCPSTTHDSEQCMSTTWLALVVVVMAATVAAQDGVSAWHRQYYPNPQDNHQDCGRPRLSHVCDPNGLLTQEEANQLDILIESLANETRCPCSNMVCRTKKTGYIIGVALMNKIDAGDDVDEATADASDLNDLWSSSKSELSDAEALPRSLDKAQLFAYTLEQEWNLGGCDEDIIILFSHADNVLYTQTGQAAARKLNAGRIGDVAVNTRQDFGPGKDIFVGLQNMIKRYRDVLNDDMSAFTAISYVRPQVAALTDSASFYTASLSLVSILSLLVACFDFLY